MKKKWIYAGYNIIVPKNWSGWSLDILLQLRLDNDDVSFRIIISWLFWSIEVYWNKISKEAK